MRAPIGGYRWALFFAVRMLNVEVKLDGTLTGTPLRAAQVRPQRGAANALYMLESGTNTSKPAAGDVIEVELR